MASIEKFSFHQSGICRKAFTSEFRPSTAVDRVTHKWKRLPAERQGLKRARRVLYLAFPTDFLSTRNTEALAKPIIWINPAPEGCATYIEMFFTREDAWAIQWHFALRGQRCLIDFLPLPNGENFAVCAHYDRWENRNVYMPASHQAKNDLMFSPHDPNSTGRPVRLFLANDPKDGDDLRGQEIGGYHITKDQLAAFRDPYATFSEVQAHDP